MKKIFIFILITFTNTIFAAAPPVDDRPLPPTPYNMKHISNLNVMVEWDKETIKKYIPEHLQNLNKLYGGISVFNSKKKQTFAPLSGSYAWIDITNSKKERSRLVFYSAYGKNNLLHKVMSNVYSLDSAKGSSKITFINQKVMARTNVKNKNVLSLAATFSDECKTKSGSFTLINYKNKNKESISKIDWKSDNVCKAKLVSSKFHYPIEKIKIANIVAVEVMTNMEKLYQAPSINGGQ